MTDDEWQVIYQAHHLTRPPLCVMLVPTQIHGCRGWHAVLPNGEILHSNLAPMGNTARLIRSRLLGPRIDWLRGITQESQLWYFREPLRRCASGSVYAFSRWTPKRETLAQKRPFGVYFDDGADSAGQL